MHVATTSCPFCHSTVVFGDECCTTCGTTIENAGITDRNHRNTQLATWRQWLILLYAFDRYFWSKALLALAQQ